MSKVVLGITVSVDGYINDKNGSITSLFSDIFETDEENAGKENNILKQAIATTGAVIMGKNAYLMAEDVDLYADNYEFQVPIFVLTHHVPEKHPKENENLKITFVTEGIQKAVELAKNVVAENKDIVIIGGAQTAQQAIKNGIVDEIQLDIMTVMLGGGVKLFTGDFMDMVKLEKIQLSETKERVSIIYRVLSELAYIKEQ